MTDYDRILASYGRTDDEHDGSVAELLAAAGLDGVTSATAPDELELDLRRLVDSLNGADPLRCAVIRRAAKEKLSEVGIVQPAGLVNAAFEARAKEHVAEASQGRGLGFRDPEAWPHPVQGHELLRDLAAVFQRFLSLPAGAAEALALWTIHSHAIGAARISPILALTSPEKRCGKSTALTILSALVLRPLFASNISAAALFRTVEAHRPTLLVDEADTFLRNNDELRGLLNSGHVPTGTVVRTVGEDFEPRAFSTWGAKALALIGDLPGTLADRAIVLPFSRRKRGEKRERLRIDRLPELEPLRRRAGRWARDNSEMLTRADPDVPSDLNDRAADNWRTLLAIADLAGGPWPALARQAAFRLSGAQEDDQSQAVQLLIDIRQLFDEAAVDRLASRQIAEKLAEREDRPWPELRGGRPITPRQVARILQRFGVRPGTVRISGETVKGYLREGFADAFERYLPADQSHPSQPSGDATVADSGARNTGDPVTDTEPPWTWPTDSIVTDVTDRGAEQ